MKIMENPWALAIKQTKVYKKEKKRKETRVLARLKKETVKT